MSGVKKDAAWWREYRRKKKEREERCEAKIFELQREAKPQPKPATVQPVVQPESATVQPLATPLQHQGASYATPTQPTAITTVKVAQPLATPNCNPSATPDLFATPVECNPSDHMIDATPLQPRVAQPHAQPQHNEEQEMSEPATPPKANVQPIRLEQITAKTSFNDLKAKVMSFIMANPKQALITTGVILFVVCNTAFLAFEQQKGFVNLGYSASVAWAVAILFELAVEVLSISLALTKRWFSWLLLAGTLGFTVYTISGMVSASAQDNVLSKLAKPTSLVTAEQSLAALSAQQSAASEAISNYDKKKQKNQIVYAMAALNKEGGLKDQINNARKVLATEQSKFENSDAYERVMKQSETHSNARKIAVAWNIVLMLFLGHLFKEKE